MLLAGVSDQSNQRSSSTKTDVEERAMSYKCSFSQIRYRINTMRVSHRVVRYGIALARGGGTASVPNQCCALVRGVGLTCKTVDHAYIVVPVFYPFLVSQTRCGPRPPRYRLGQYSFDAWAVHPGARERHTTRRGRERDHGSKQKDNSSSPFLIMVVASVFAYCF